jgi:hypothetical protein
LHRSLPCFCALQPRKRSPSLLLYSHCRLHLSRSADVENVPAQPQAATAVVVHPPPSHESHPPAAAAAVRDDAVPESVSSAETAAAESSSFSLFSVLTRWNKEEDDGLRAQEFQEQVRSPPTKKILPSFAFVGVPSFRHVIEQESSMGSRGLGLMQATASSRSASECRRCASFCVRMYRQNNRAIASFLRLERRPFFSFSLHLAASNFSRAKARSRNSGSGW